MLQDLAYLRSSNTTFNINDNILKNHFLIHEKLLN